MNGASRVVGEVRPAGRSRAARRTWPARPPTRPAARRPSAGAIRSTERSRRATVAVTPVPRRQRGGHLVDGEPRVGVQHLGDLRREGRRGDHDVGGGAVGHDLAVGQHHHPVGGAGDELDVVGGDDDGAPVGGELAEQPR